MLQEGQAEASAGRDVVIAYLEPHGRAETEDQAEGLELLPRRKFEYRGSELWELDLPAIFQRAPELALVDELAHTNPPGLEHGKRYEDIEDMLEAGIDVFSTVNVQHLESLNDRVAELTGVRVRETFPDTVLAEGRRGRPHRPDPRGADRPPAGGQDLPALSASRPRSTTSSGSRTSRPCASSHCARRPRRSRRERGQSAPRSRSAPGTQLIGRGAAGRGRACAGAGSPAELIAAPGSPRLALGPAPWRRPRPALCRRPRLRARRGRARAARALSRLAAVLGARLLDRGGRRCRRGCCRGGRRARHHLHPDRPAPAADRPRSLPRIAPRTAHPQGPGGRRSDRRRPRTTGGGR